MLSLQEIQVVPFDVELEMSVLQSGKCFFWDVLVPLFFASLAMR